MCETIAEVFMNGVCKINGLRNTLSTNLHSRNGFCYSTKQKPNLKGIRNSLFTLPLLVFSNCSYSSYIGEEPTDEQAKRTDNANKIIKDDAQYRFVSDRVNHIFSVLELFKNNNTSITSVGTVCYYDNHNNRHYIKLLQYGNEITGKGITINAQDSPKEIYDFKIENYKNDAIKITKYNSNQTLDKIYYRVNDDNSVSKTEYLNNNIARYSVLKKQEDGSILQIFSDDTTMNYDKISNNVPYPTPITFSASIEDMQ